MKNVQRNVKGSSKNILGLFLKNTIGKKPEKNMNLVNVRKNDSKSGQIIPSMNQPGIKEMIRQKGLGPMVDIKAPSANKRRDMPSLLPRPEISNKSGIGNIPMNRNINIPIINQKSEAQIRAEMERSILRRIMNRGRQ